jgi:hypothetical protein
MPRVLEGAGDAGSQAVLPAGFVEIVFRRGEGSAVFGQRASVFTGAAGRTGEPRRALEDLWRPAARGPADAEPARIE